MADTNNGDGHQKLRADPLNLTNIDNIEMLIRENAGDISAIVKQIMQRFIGDNPLTESEMELAGYLNDLVLSQQADKADLIEVMDMENKQAWYRGGRNERNDQ